MEQKRIKRKIIRAFEDSSKRATTEFSPVKSISPERQADLFGSVQVSQKLNKAMNRMDMRMVNKTPDQPIRHLKTNSERQWNTIEAGGKGAYGPSSKVGNGAVNKSFAQPMNLLDLYVNEDLAIP